MKKSIWLAVVLGVLATGVEAQNRRQPAKPAAEKRLYCWDEGGQRVCGDALPAHAVDAARTELSARSGRPLAQVDEAMTPEERAAAEEAARQAEVAAAAEAARQRRERAMAESYETEEELRKAFDDRIVLVDEALKTSRMGVANLRQSLVSLLRQANDLELRGEPVRKRLLDSIQSQHRDLLRQQAIMRQQLEARASTTRSAAAATGAEQAQRGVGAPRSQPIAPSAATRPVAKQAVSR
jgi:regulator of replication initiation timing